MGGLLNVVRFETPFPEMRTDLFEDCNVIEEAVCKTVCRYLNNPVSCDIQILNNDDELITFLTGRLRTHADKRLLDFAINMVSDNVNKIIAAASFDELSLFIGYVRNSGYIYDRSRNVVSWYIETRRDRNNSTFVSRYPQT